MRTLRRNRPRVLMIVSLGVSTLVYLSSSRFITAACVTTSNSNHKQFFILLSIINKITRVEHLPSFGPALPQPPVLSRPIRNPQPALSRIINTPLYYIEIENINSNSKDIPKWVLATLRIRFRGVRVDSTPLELNSDKLCWPVCRMRVFEST